MKRDFTLNVFRELLRVLIKKQYHILTYTEFITKSEFIADLVILRHDVDRIPINALKMARIEHEFDVKATYYFRVVDGCYDEKIIREVAELGHEIAYHYEDLSFHKGDYEKAIKSFEINLNKLRQFYPVTTICMHGSPTSKWDNRLLWNKYDYRDFDLIAEPYFDVDYNDIFYLTDTGRKWNNIDSNVRDKVQTKYEFRFNSTMEVIKAFEEKRFPSKIMMNLHPHRWNNNFVFWFYELFFQNFKNLLKKYYFITKQIDVNS